MCTFKPDRRAFLHTAKAMDRRPEDCWMVAAHDWDVHGAMTAGLAGAYLARPATPYHPRLLRPTLASAHLAELVEGVLASPRALA